MSRFMVVSLICVIVAVLAAFIVKVSVTATASDEGCGANHIVSSPNVGLGYNILNGEAVVSARDIWAVGSYVNDDSVEQTLIEHWNGTSWHIVPSPNVGVGINELYAVSAVSTQDVWTVGSYANSQTGIYPAQTLTEHWDGTNWSIIPSPNPGSIYNVLYGVAAVSASNIWTVGYDNSDLIGGRVRTLISHWDGTGWSIVSSPNPGNFDNELFGVTIVAAKNVWAVGLSQNSGSNVQTLTERWNGTTWNIVPSPNLSTEYNVLYGVERVPGTKQVWAVGHFKDGNSYLTLTEYWDGKVWNFVPSPDLGNFFNDLRGVAAISARDVWAVGLFSQDNHSVKQTLIEHWDGTKWSVVKSPSPSLRNNTLSGVVRLPKTRQILTVGQYNNDRGYEHTLVVSYC